MYSDKSIMFISWVDRIKDNVQDAEAWNNIYDRLNSGRPLEADEDRAITIWAANNGAPDYWYESEKWLMKRSKDFMDRQSYLADGLSKEELLDKIKADDVKWNEVVDFCSDTHLRWTKEIEQIRNDKLSEAIEEVVDKDDKYTKQICNDIYRYCQRDFRTIRKAVDGDNPNLVIEGALNVPFDIEKSNMGYADVPLDVCKLIMPDLLDCSRKNICDEIRNDEDYSDRDKVELSDRPVASWVEQYGYAAYMAGELSWVWDKEQAEDDWWNSWSPIEVVSDSVSEEMYTGVRCAADLYKSTRLNVPFNNNVSILNQRAANCLSNAKEFVKMEFGLDDVYEKYEALPEEEAMLNTFTDYYKKGFELSDDELHDYTRADINWYFNELRHMVDVTHNEDELLRFEPDEKSVELIEDIYFRDKDLAVLGTATAKDISEAYITAYTLHRQMETGKDYGDNAREIYDVIKSDSQYDFKLFTEIKDAYINFGRDGGVDFEDVFSSRLEKAEAKFGNIQDDADCDFEYDDYD